MNGPTEVDIHRAHWTLSEIAKQYMEQFVEFERQGKTKQAKEAYAKSEEWLKLALGMEELMKS